MPQLENFDFIKSRGEELYKSFSPVKCPYFNELVYFNAQGLRHLKYKQGVRDRLPQDQYMRFKLLYLAPEILKLTRTLQGRSNRKGFERMHINGKWKYVLVQKSYFEFIAIIDDFRVRIIIRRINDGPLHFYSVIPFWGDGSNFERLMSFGNPEED